VAARALEAHVPSCPEWNVEALVRHTSAVYLHKVECMRKGEFPKPWPPDFIKTDEPLALFDRAYNDLAAEFASRKPEDETVTWYEPEQTVGFWIRRMAQETVIHRVDAELALGEDIALIPEDLAVDGIDEILERFVSWPSIKWASEIKEELPETELPPIVVKTGGAAWTLGFTPAGVMLERGATEGSARVEGDATPMLLWVWRRTEDGVATTGDTELIATFREFLFNATQ